MSSPSNDPRPSAARLYGMIAFMVVSWALSFVVGKFALREIPALMLPGLRAGMAAICLLPLYFWDARRPAHRPLRWADAPQLAAVAICGVTFNQLFFITGLSRTSVGHASVVIALTPILVLSLAAAAGQERVTLAKLSGMIVALSGVALLHVAKVSGTAATLFGDMLLFFGALSFAIYTVVGKQISLRYSSITMNAFAYTAGALTLAPVTVWQASSTKLGQISSNAWLGVAYMAIFPSVLAYLIYYYALTHIPASRVAAFSYLQPVLATLLAFGFLGEPVTRSLAAGGALVLAGVWVAER